MPNLILLILGLQVAVAHATNPATPLPSSLPPEYGEAVVIIKQSGAIGEDWNLNPLTQRVYTADQPYELRVYKLAASNRVAFELCDHKMQYCKSLGPKLDYSLEAYQSIVDSAQQKQIWDAVTSPKAVIGGVSGLALGQVGSFWLCLKTTSSNYVRAMGCFIVFSYIGASIYTVPVLISGVLGGMLGTYTEYQESREVYDLGGADWGGAEDAASDPIFIEVSDVLAAHRDLTEYLREVFAKEAETARKEGLRLQPPVDVRL